MDGLIDALELVNLRIPDSPVEKLEFQNSNRHAGNILNIKFKNGDVIGIKFSQIHAFITD